MTDILQTAMGVLTQASVYLLIGLGWNLVYNASGFLNLAIGEFYVLGAVLSYVLYGVLGGTLVAGMVAVLAVGVLAALADALLLRPLADRKLAPLVVTIGLALVLLQVSRSFVPHDVIRPDPLVAGSTVAGVTISYQEILVWATAAVLTASMWLVFTRTDAGRTLRACADDYRAARALGIRVRSYGVAAFAAAAMLAAVAGVVVAPTQGMTYNAGTLIAIKSLLAVSIGGMGRYGGAVVGAFVVAAAEAVIARYWSSTYRDLVVLAGFLLVLYTHVIDRAAVAAAVRGLAPQRSAR